VLKGATPAWKDNISKWGYGVLVVVQTKSYELEAYLYAVL
jgi:hypothetical protein